jgi:phosphoserine aminotransferase
MENQKSIKVVQREILARFNQWKDFLQKQKSLKLLIENKAVQSYTVLAITAAPYNVSLVKSKAKKAGFLLGEGYGNLKPNTFRIANFPAIQAKEIKALQKFLNSLAKK